MIYDVKLYGVACDCDDDCEVCYGTCFYDAPTESIARGHAERAGWVEIDGKHYCPECQDRPPHKGGQ